LHLDAPDPECRVVNLVQETSKTAVNIVLKNNFAMGGVNVALVFRRWGGA